MLTLGYRIERWKGLHKPIASAHILLLAREGRRVYPRCDKPYILYSPERNERELSHWVISGSLQVKIDGVGIFVLQAGDRDFLPPNYTCSRMCVSEEPVVYLIGVKKPDEEKEPDMPTVKRAVAKRKTGPKKRPKTKAKKTKAKKTTP